jgi:hypothetical protein
MQQYIEIHDYHGGNIMFQYIINYVIEDGEKAFTCTLETRFKLSSFVPKSVTVIYGQIGFFCNQKASILTHR